MQNFAEGPDAYKSATQSTQSGSVQRVPSQPTGFSKSLSQDRTLSKGSSISSQLAIAYGNEGGGIGRTVSTTPMVVDVRHELAMALLRGSHADLGLCCMSMLLSLGFAVAGVVAMTDNEEERIIAVQSVAFLMAQSFGLSRVWRDWSMCNDSDIAKPSYIYLGFVVTFFILAVTGATYSVARVVEWHSFYVLALAWVTASAIMTSKAVRDRDFATKFILRPEAASQLDIVWICSGSHVYQIVVWISAVFAVATTLISMWTWETESMKLEMKGFFFLCVFFAQGSTFHLGKLMHDRADPLKARELRKHIPFQIVVVLSTAVSYIVPVVVVCFIELGTAKRFFLLVGLAFMMCTSFFLVKHAKDRHEFENLMLPMEHHPLGAVTESFGQRDYHTSPIGEERNSRGNSMPPPGGSQLGRYDVGAARPQLMDAPVGRADGQALPMPPPMSPQAPQPPALPPAFPPSLPATRTSFSPSPPASEDYQTPGSDEERTIEHLSNLRRSLRENSAKLDNLNLDQGSLGADGHLKESPGSFGLADEDVAPETAHFAQ